MKTQKGQIIIILLLVTLVSLTVGIAVTQRSVTDISISTKTEQSSRAFSAAEAGIEKAIRSQTNVQNLQLGNETQADVSTQTNLPSTGQLLEYPPIGKTEFAHFWLANPSTDPPARYFDRNRIAIYFGNSEYTGSGNSPNSNFDPNDKPAVEINIITRPNGASISYIPNKFYLDSDNTRTSANGFEGPGATDPNFRCDNPSVVTSEGNNRRFYCQKELPLNASEIPVLARVRVLYSNKSQVIAMGPGPSLGSCTNQNCSLPPQASIYESTGISGQTQRKIKVFRVDKVVPYYFDYSVFSAGDIVKR